MELRVTSMGRQHLDACGKIVNGLELFQLYRMDGAAASKLLQAAMQEGRADLRVALDGSGKVLGFAWLVSRGSFDRSSYLRLIAVEPTLRRGGVGRHLVEALEATHLHHGGITLLVSSNNRPGQRFYEALGYSQVGILSEYIRPELDELIYFKPAPRR